MNGQSKAHSAAFAFLAQAEAPLNPPKMLPASQADVSAAFCPYQT
jgi:hypothetical protein